MLLGIPFDPHIDCSCCLLIFKKHFCCVCIWLYYSLSLYKSIGLIITAFKVQQVPFQSTNFLGRHQNLNHNKWLLIYLSAVKIFCRVSISSCRNNFRISLAIVLVINNVTHYINHGCLSGNTSWSDRATRRSLLKY